MAQTLAFNCLRLVYSTIKGNAQPNFDVCTGKNVLPKKVITKISSPLNQHFCRVLESL